MFKNSTLQQGKNAPYLGILPNMPPPASGVASSESPLQPIKFDSDGVVIEPIPDKTSSRITRFVRQSVARELLPESRVSWCLRRTLENEVKILKSSHGTAHYSGLMACSRAWECPVCAAKISERRRGELVKLIDSHKQASGSCMLLTFTFSHTRFDDLSQTLDKVSKAWRHMTKSRAFRNLMSDLSVIGSVRAFEVTWGKSNGWHPHYHVIWFSELAQLPSFDLIRHNLYCLWRSVCVRFDLGIPSPTRGVDVRNGDYAAQYAAKFGLEDSAKRQWGLADELARAHTKNGRNGHHSPFQLLDLYADGQKYAGDLFREYVTCFKGARQLVFSNGLKSRYDVAETTDEELAVVQDDSAVVLGSITLDQWRVILRKSGRFQDNRAIVLTLAENGGMEAVYLFLIGLESDFDSS